MRVLKLQSLQTPERSIIQSAAEVLGQSGVVLCPSDTCYILAANTLVENAVRKVFTIKERPFDKPLGVMVSSIKDAERVVEINKKARAIYQKFFPGHLTVISPKKDVVPDILTGGGKTLGVSIPDSVFALNLAKTARVPYTGTSANRSGGKVPYSTKEALEQFSKEQKRLIDLVIDAGNLPRVSTTTILDLVSDPPKILRQGSIAKEEIEKVLGKKVEVTAK